MKMRMKKRGKEGDDRAHNAELSVFPENVADQIELMAMEMLHKSSPATAISTATTTKSVSVTTRDDDNRRQRLCKRVCDGNSNYHQHQHQHQHYCYQFQHQSNGINDDGYQNVRIAQRTLRALQNAIVYNDKTMTRSLTT